MRSSDQSMQNPEGPERQEPSAISVQLGAVQETMLVPLYGRAALTLEGSALINDHKAVEIVGQMDYDFTVFDGSMSLLGSVFRTRIFDHWISRWLSDHPDGTVVEIGVGLNSRYERLDNGRAYWIELDLPDVIELRRQFFDDTDRRKIVSASVLDDSWHDLAGATGGPWLFAAEAVLIYLDPAEVTSVLSVLARRYPGCLLATDTWTTWMADHQDEHDAISAMDAEFRWFCDHLSAFDVPNVTIEVLERCGLPDAPAPVARLLPDAVRSAIPTMAIDPLASSYHQNLIALHPEH